MPFKSDKQRRFMYSQHPEIAKKWSKKECGGPIQDPIAMERLPGGKGEEHDPGDFDQVQLMKGIHHEMEHSRDVVTAMEIAMDHLSEDPIYYDHLEQAEQQGPPEPCEQKMLPKLEDIYCSVDPRHDPQEPWDPNPNQDVHKNLRFRQASIMTGR